MFRLLGLFSPVVCPQRDTCTRNPCPFTHSLAIQPKKEFEPVPVLDHKAIPAKRPAPVDTARDDNAAIVSEPPKKYQAVAPANGRSVKPLPRPVPVPLPNTSGPPTLSINAAHSKIPMKDRQQMLALLWQEYTALYSSIVPPDPSLANDHALAHEKDIYDKTVTNTYRNAVKTAVVSLRKRERPTSASHPSVGTEAQLAQRAKEQESLGAMTLARIDVQPAVLSPEELAKWDYVIEIPEGEGGTSPNDDGKAKMCERCKKEFIVNGDELDKEACRFHWARGRVQKMAGKRETFFSCCSSTDPEAGCQLGAHVFRDATAAELHSRHPFTPTNLTTHPEGEEGALQVIALDCEMIYTTQGMSCARVTVLDGKGDKVLDELLRLDEGVKVLDYNTRFSGITDLTTAVFDLNGVREALAHFISPSTIIIGHALENDLKTMRMIHHHVVDTVQLYPLQTGHPMRPSLRTLARAHLDRIIQASGAQGHSSMEDSLATLDLVKLWVKHRRQLTAARSTGTS